MLRHVVPDERQRQAAGFGTTMATIISF